MDRATWLTIGIVAGVASIVLTTLVTAILLVRLPSDFIVAHRPVKFGPYFLMRNLLGWLLILVGIVLSIPGVPGQGLLTIFCGLLIADVPGKRRMLFWLLRRPAVAGAVNRLRHKFGRPPFTLPEGMHR